MKSPLEVGRRGWTWLGTRESFMQRLNRAAQRSFQGHIRAALVTSCVHEWRLLTALQKKELAKLNQQLIPKRLDWANNALGEARICRSSRSIDGDSLVKCGRYALQLPLNYSYKLNKCKLVNKYKLYQDNTYKLFNNTRALSFFFFFGMERTVTSEGWAHHWQQLPPGCPQW